MEVAPTPMQEFTGSFQNKSRGAPLATTCSVPRRGNHVQTSLAGVAQRGAAGSRVARPVWRIRLTLALYGLNGPLPGGARGK